MTDFDDDREARDIQAFRDELDDSCKRRRESEQFAAAIVRGIVGESVIVDAVDRAFAAIARLGMLPTRKSLRRVALVHLAALVDMEIDRRLEIARRQRAGRRAA